jgi:hypothetical protein
MTASIHDRGHILRTVRAIFFITAIVCSTAVVFTFRCLLKATKELLMEIYCTRNFSEDRFPFV